VVDAIAQLYAELGVTQSHSRPNVSNDNPFFEAQFKTLKYQPDFPERFGSVQHARAEGVAARARVREAAHGRRAPQAHRS
jgi:hypothetical protein